MAQIHNAGNWRHGKTAGCPPFFLDDIHFEKGTIAMFLQPPISSSQNIILILMINITHIVFVGTWRGVV